MSEPVPISEIANLPTPDLIEARKTLARRIAREKAYYEAPTFTVAGHTFPAQLEQKLPPPSR